MGSPSRALSITHYGLLMAVVVIGSLVIYGLAVDSELRKVRQDVQQNNLRQGEEELASAIDQVLIQATRTANRFSQWEEVRQQLDIPHYYSYWRNHRMLQTNIIPGHVIDAEIYDKSGKALALRNEAGLPGFIDGNLPKPYVEWLNGEPSLVYFAQVRFDDQLQGYVALRERFMQRIREGVIYQYLDASTLRFSDSAGRFDWSELLAHLNFKLRDNPMGNAVEDVLTSAIVNLSVMLMSITFILLPILVLMLAQPLRSISAHIDRLRQSPGGLMLGNLGGWFRISETEKIRESLNSYQAELLDMHSHLEQKSQELWDMAHHDALTNVPNRRAFDDYWRNLPANLVEQYGGVCFALFDVNHFKAINDTYGHQTGDEVLKVIASLVGDALSEQGRLFRLGGDEFAAVLLDCNQELAQALADKCQDRISRYDFKSLGIEEPVKISIGLSHVNSAEDDQVLRALQWMADVAMYSAKRPGYGHIAFYTPELAKGAEGVFSNWINTAVYEAVTQGDGVEMFYQPVMDIVTSKVAYYEALLRIKRGDEWILPSNIFQVVEARRLEIELDRVVLNQVLKDLQNSVLPEGTGVSINLSGPSVVKDQLYSWLEPFLPFLDRYSIVLEVTETSLITQIGMASKNLAKLQQSGFTIALDDFGSGYSSVRYLAGMPVDTVKFDIMLIRCLDNASQRNIVSHLAQMILESGHKLVAEGIESKESLEQVRALGFNYVQGYHFGRPQPVTSVLNHTHDGTAH